ncbi:MAG: proline--tRNA ligase [Candidatus Goldbacteria bacterium]|nr:proline--tRNA ligase [Candidatus Goldiibacteriota bacterium]
MKWTKALINTIRETPKEAETASHKLMLKAGLILKLSSGIYDFLPLGWKSVSKVTNIIREEMNKSGAQEILMPILSPAELWQETGRWSLYGKEMMRVKDRNDGEFALGPTHEEIITDIVRRQISSYKQLPVNLYQIQVKFRDEIRPRFGVMRAREFIMKDAYSFDRNENDAQESYKKMFETYNNICKRIGFKFRAVEADTGAIGGTSSAEFMVLADTGEETIVYCPDCSYAANVEKATGTVDAIGGNAGEKLEKIHTPDIRTVEELASFLKLKPEDTAKTILYVADGKMYGVMMRGDREINEIKLKNVLSAEEIRLATPEEIEKATNAPVGFAGPVNLREKGIMLLIDKTVESMKSLVCGGNEKDYHYTGVVRGRDFKEDKIVDVVKIKAGDGCPKCGKKLQEQKGIEVGHVFFLGTKYSTSMNATFLDENGKSQYFVMGCYGIGVTRMVAAAIEQNYDENGIIWPIAIAPYEVSVIPVNVKYTEGFEYAEKIYNELREKGVDVILDDRDCSPGVKFKDSDLIGFPIRIIIGEKNFKNKKTEIKMRRDGKTILIDLDKTIDEVLNIIDGLRKQIN